MRTNTMMNSGDTPGRKDDVVMLKPAYSKEEHERRATAMYEQVVRPMVEAGNRGKIVAIDVDSGEFEVASDSLTASKSLLASRPEAQIWCIRIGHQAVHSFGPRLRIGTAE